MISPRKAIGLSRVVQRPGRDFIDPGKLTIAADLETTEAAQGLRVGICDIVLVRLARDARRLTVTDQDVAGIDHEGAVWLHERQVAVVSGGCVHDPIPSGRVAPNWPMRIHMSGLVSVGLHVLDSLNLEGVARTCIAETRSEFLLTLAPLRIQGRAGLPLSPIAMF